MAQSKSIVIIGGGISGLSVLHYLKKKYKDVPSVKILLLEKDSRIGGTIQTEYQQDWVFEHGPNGFLDRDEQALALVEELGLQDQLLSANPVSSQRFISIQNELHGVPTGLGSLLRFKPLSIFDKLRIPFEIFVRRGRNPQETVYEFGKRRLGENFSKIFLDPLVTGIYAGDVHRLNLKSAFPRIYEIEQKYGSLFKGMMPLVQRRTGRSSKESSSKSSKTPIGSPGGRLFSFKGGMSQLIETFYSRHKENILLKEEVISIHPKDEQFIVETSIKNLLVDSLFLCVPAYAAGAVVKSIFPLMSFQMEKIEYAPVAVVGLVYRKEAFPKILKGFGYLVPSSEKKEVLGVLFENQIFPHRSDDRHALFRIMIGGSHHPDIVSRTPSELRCLAKEEIRRVLGAQEDPLHAFVRIWPKAIPQYNTGDLWGRSIIEKEVLATKNFFIVSNYLGGVSFTDCLASAQRAVEQLARGGDLKGSDLYS